MKTKTINPNTPLNWRHWLFWIVLSLGVHFTVTGILSKNPKLLTRDDAMLDGPDKSRALADFCLMLYNLNEFIYVD